MPLNAQYSVVSPKSLAAKIGGYQRRRMFARFLSSPTLRPDDTIVDIGVTGDPSYKHSNHLAAWYPHKRKLTSVVIDDAPTFEKQYPGVAYRQADGRALPFADGSFDFVHSNAVIEHVGSREQQVKFLAELWRVCRKGLFVTTPNRWFPVEFHTVMPLVHWLPRVAFRRTLQFIGHHELAQEANLNLMSRTDLLDAATAAGISAARVEGVRLAGWTSNLLLIAQKRG